MNEQENEKIEVKIEETKVNPQEPDTEKSEKPKKQSKGTWKLFVGIAVGILATLLGMLLYRGYFTIELPGIGLYTVKLPTYGVFNKNTARIDYEELERKLDSIEYFMDTEYYYDKNTEGLVDEAVRGIFAKYTEEDDYSQYYTAEEYAAEVESWSGSYVGIGAYVTTDETTGGILVVRPIKGGPAEEAGIKEGDIIISADGIDVRGMELDSAISDYIKGDEGTVVVLEIYRDGETMEIPVTRRSVDTESVYYSVIEGTDGKTGYIYISSFLQSTYANFVEAVNYMEEMKVDGIVIDLRDNLGGDMNTCLNMCDYILDDDLSDYSANEPLESEKGKTLLLCVRSKDGKDEKYYACDGHSCDIPITVLVNGYSASASEIFSGVLGSYGYTICGLQTYGKGIVQTVRMLYDMSGIKYTSEEYILPDSSHIHGVGITPDIIVEPSEKLSEEGADPENPDLSVDNMLNEAVRSLGD